mmetsp:Transcript_17711/g.45361  ORF Transcript_17711/g.45361 Transcript_17711/m.45361 type:complete len:210 (-) Transcript_17711:66-695(-)
MLCAARLCRSSACLASYSRCRRSISGLALTDRRRPCCSFQSVSLGSRWRPCASQRDSRPASSNAIATAQPLTPSAKLVGCHVGSGSGTAITWYVSPLVSRWAAASATSAAPTSTCSSATASPRRHHHPSSSTSSYSSSSPSSSPPSAVAGIMREIRRQRRWRWRWRWRGAPVGSSGSGEVAPGWMAPGRRSDAILWRPSPVTTQPQCLP